MMTRDQVDQAQKLLRQIKLLEADLEEYRKAETFVVGVNKSKMGPGNLLFANKHTFPAAVIGGSIFLTLCAACFFGLVIPSLLHWLRLDPKIAAGPITLALTDIATLLFYFNMGSVML